MLYNEVSAIDECEQKAIIDHIIDIAERETSTYSLGITSS